MRILICLLSLLLSLTSCYTQPPKDISTLEGYTQPKGVIKTPLPYIYAYYEHIGERPYMEDRHVIYTTENYMIAAVFDGHGGQQTAEWLKGELPRRLVQVLNALGPQAKIGQQKQAIIQCYQDLDKEFFTELKKDKDTSGSTAVVYLAIKYPNKEKREMLINIGDSRAIVTRDKKVRLETKDHKPDNKEEKRRITDNKGEVKYGRVWPYGYYKYAPGGLAVSRAFGDPDSKQKDQNYFSGWISAKPDVEEISTEPGDYVVLASDGLWDDMDSGEVANFITKNSSQNIAEALVAKVQSIPKPMPRKSSSETVRFFSGSTEDNISVIVLRREKGE